MLNYRRYYCETGVAEAEGVIPAGLCRNLQGGGAPSSGGCASFHHVCRFLRQPRRERPFCNSELCSGAFSDTDWRTPLADTLHSPTLCFLLVSAHSSLHFQQTVVHGACCTPKVALPFFVGQNQTLSLSSPFVRCGSPMDSASRTFSNVIRRTWPQPLAWNLRVKCCCTVAPSLA